MKYLILPILIGLFLSGCQTPIISTRTYSFESKFLTGGKSYELKFPYICHNEDLSWISTRGSDWHIREGRNSVKIFGRLEDKSRFAVLPRIKQWDYSFCSEQTTPIDVRLFVEVDDIKVESFDRFKNTSSIRKVSLLESKLSRLRSGLDAFSEQQNWPPQATPSKRFYTIYAIIYEKSVWKNKPRIIDLIENKKIVWLENGKTYPFTTWADNNREFGRIREFDPSINGYTDPAPRIPLIPEGEDWNLLAPSNSAVQWRLEPLPANAKEENEVVPSEKFKRWIIFNDSRIEIPLRSHYRTFYQPKQERILEFRVEHVDLW